MNDGAWWALTGTLVGALQAFTGAGGAILGVPLFMWGLGTTLPQATVYSLFAVIFAAAFNGFLQRAKAQVKTAVILGAFATAGSALTKSWKTSAPTWVIQALFAGVCVYAVVAMLRGTPKASASGKKKLAIPAWAQIPPVGAFIGLLTTMTGLGGGVVMVPWLHRGLKLPMANAVPTSVVAVLFSALAALFFQRDVAFEGVKPEYLVALALGTIASAILSRRVLSRIPPEKSERLRRTLFIAVVIVSVLTVILRG